jgi:single-strand DNA-binding protein
MTTTRTKSKETPTAKVGNLTADPELRFAPSGLAVANFSLAHSPYPNPDNVTTFYRCVAFGDLGENVAVCLRKGDRVCVVGRGHIERWKSDDGKEGADKQIICDGVGPDLRWATADIHRIKRGGRPTPGNGSAGNVNDVDPETGEIRPSDPQQGSWPVDNEPF